MLRNLRSQWDLPTFFSCVRLGEMSSCLFLYLVHGGIIMAWIVVKQDNPLDIAVTGNVYGLHPSAMSPTNAVRILLWSVLRIVDQDVGILRVFTQNFVQLRFTMFDIARMSYHRVADLDSETRCALGMVQRKRIYFC